ncbi:MerR family transcriptional regulator [Candidatus Amarobacter glycogenicus]|uniref:MerR family transcriptional regulator n=1 Tax=Candidatus Amarobacter glycogenicus TaxID=3140699 RepID=UPI003136B790|nr:MerR family transcriptional regulator [Dehalococcoidia bacterium]
MLIRIGALSETTGVSEDVLRSWERRYGLLTPQRTAGGFRLYGDDDVQRVRTMVSLLSGGLSAGDAARHILETSVPAAANGSLPSTNAVVEELQGRLHGALRGFDDHALEAAIDAVLAALDLDTAIRDVFIPALKAIGDDWAAGTVSVAQEHFAVNVLRARLMALARGWDQGFGPRALLACPPDEHHDVSLVLFGLALRRRGWRITFLGANTPIADITATSRKLAPELAVLYASDWRAYEPIFPELKSHAGPATALGGATSGTAVEATGWRHLDGDPVAAADQATREFQPKRRNSTVAETGDGTAG